MAYKPEYYMDSSSKHSLICSRVLVYGYGRCGFILHITIVGGVQIRLS